MKILHVIPSLSPSGAARQLTLLVPRLPRDRFDPEVVCLGVEAPWADTLRQAGVPTRCCGRRGPLDLRFLPELRRSLNSFVPDVVHAWGIGALRALAPLAWNRRVVITGPTPSGIFDRKLVEFIAGGRAAVPLAVPPSVAPPSRQETTRALGLADDTRWLAGVGPLDAAKDFRNVIWGFDILRFVRTELHLVLVGSGPDEPRLRRFAGLMHATKQVHFIGYRPDIRGILTHAEAFWAASPFGRGANAALEALACGCPVVAAHRPSLAEVVGAAGLLVPPRDPAAFAKATHQLLDDAPRRAALVEAGRRRAATFALEGALSALEKTYCDAQSIS